MLHPPEQRLPALVLDEPVSDRDHLLGITKSFQPLDESVRRLRTELPGRHPVHHPHLTFHPTFLSAPRLRLPATLSRSVRPRTPGALRSVRARSPAGGTTRSRESPPARTPPGRAAAPRRREARGIRTTPVSMGRYRGRIAPCSDSLPPGAVDPCQGSAHPATPACAARCGRCVSEAVRAVWG